MQTSVTMISSIASIFILSDVAIFGFTPMTLIALGAGAVIVVGILFGNR
jgi:hypothetical protein